MSYTLETALQSIEENGSFVIDETFIMVILKDFNEISTLGEYLDYL